MINRHLRNVIHAIVGLAAVVASGIAAADPPSRVARMANVNGAVSFSPAGEDEWVAATPNRPLITGDSVWSDSGARAELQIGSLAVRLGSQTSVTILNLDDRVAQFQLEQGTLNVHVRRIDGGQILEVDTPLLAFAIEQPGDYRIDVDSGSAATTIAVRSGQGAAYGEGAAYTIGARQWYRFADTALRDYEYDALPRADAFDAWTRDRDRREDNPVAARYVSPEVIGYADLDEYGTWSVVEGYGNVWIPTSVASDWAPYHYGHWAWIEPWGWTWVDDAPWGFAPFHYGRWAYARERWCWVPGPARVRPVYAPALVAFVGGSDFRVSVGSGGPARGIAWFPLAPGEVYRPSYHVSRNYFTNVNVSSTNLTNTYVTNVYAQPDAANAVYRNRGQRGGVTAMPAAAFVQSRPVAQSAVPLPRDIATAGPVTSVALIAPIRASVIGAARATPVERPPATTMQRPVVARVAPPPPPPPFNVREGALAKDPGRPADPAALVAPRQPTTVAPIAPAVKLVAPGAPATPPPAPTAPRPRADVPQPAAAGAAPALPSALPNAPAMGPRPGATLPVPPPSIAPTPPDTKPVRSDAGGQPPKVDVAPPPSAIRVPPTGPQPAASSPLAPQPPKVMERQVMPPQPAAVERPPAAPAPTPTELRRNPPAPQAPAVASPPAAPLPPPAELRRAPPPPPAPVDVKPPAAPLTLPVEPRRGPPPPQAPADVKPPAASLPPPTELRRESLPPAAAPRPPAVQPPPVPIAPTVPAPPVPQTVRPAAAAVSPPPPSVRQPEPNPNSERGKVEPPKGRPDDKRDEPK